MKILPLLLVGAIGLSLAGCDRHAMRATRQIERSERQAGQAHGLKRACRADIEQFCAASQKGRERRQCLESHSDKLSDGCKQALSERGSGHRGGGRRNRGADTGTDGQDD
jgi:hypothetical protein